MPCFLSLFLLYKSSRIPSLFHKMQQPLTCPPNSSYSLCVSSCPETCLGVVGPPGCEEVCVEGCECNPGFILSDDKCNPWFASKCIFIILIFIFV
uniref:TIL domain-containing protein n=1 Tax=Maylandia zebra TaxID=106582 RepID=A0A3P9DU34_9CICH